MLNIVKCVTLTFSDDLVPRSNNTTWDRAAGSICLSWCLLFVLSCEQDFTKALKNYVDHGYQKDSAALSMGGSEINEFTSLLELAASGMKR